MGSQKFFVVVNPASANGRTGRRWPELAARLRTVLGSYEVMFTDYSGHGIALTRQALARGADVVVSVGGDGTHNEVANGFLSGDPKVSTNPKMAIVPTGTGGDLRRTLGLPQDPLDAIELIGTAWRRVDVGHLSCVDSVGAPLDRHFINIASFGMAGLVDQLVNSTTKALGGKASFVMAVARAARRYRNQRVLIQVDDGPLRPHVIQNTIVANARYFGGGMHVAPNADMTDGFFDVITVGDLSLVETAQGMPRIFKGHHLDMNKVSVARATRIYAEPQVPDEVVLIDLDGEQPGRLPATFSVVPMALEIGVGPDAKLPPT